jgi:glutamate dehydrogenase (NAD(P)+)
VNEENMQNLKAKLVVEGANIPVTEGAEKYLHEKGVLCIPDFIANAGGVICAAMEYRGKIESEALAVIQDKVRTNTRLVLEESRNKNILPREAAMNLAVTRVEKAMSYKRWSIY